MTTLEALCQACYQKLICEVYFQRRIATCPSCRTQWRPNEPNEPESEQDSVNSAIDEANLGMLVAAEAGYEDIVRLMLFRGANNFNLAMAGAAKKNHLNIIELMLEKEANDFNLAMSWAASNN